MSRVLLISYAFPPFGGAASRRVSKLVKYLDRQGCQSIVVTAPRVINPLIDEAAAGEVPPSAVIFRTASLEPVPSPGRSRPWLLFLRRVLNIPMVPNVTLLWAVCALAPAVAAAKRYGPSVIICSAPEFPAFVVGAAVKRATGIPLILDYRDEWSFHPLKEQSAKSSRLRRLKQSLELRMEKRLAAYADLVIANTESFKAQFEKILGLAPGRVRVITNGFDPDDFPQEGHAENNAGSANREAKRIVVTYLGSVDHSSLFPPELLITLDQAGGQTGGRILLRVIGNIYPELERRLFEEKFRNLEVVTTGFIPARKALALLLESDVNLLVMDDVPGKERYHNIKLFDYLYTMKPLLVYGPAESEIGRAALASGIGRVVERGDEPGLLRAMTEALKGDSADSPDRAYIEGFDWRRLSRKFFEIIEEVSRGS